jgi:hypothetical protein
MTTDPFERFSIPHISISALRLFTESQATYCAKYLYKIPDETGPAAWRGLAVEAGVDRLLFGDGEAAATAAVYTEWDNKAQGLIDDEAAKEFEVLTSFLIQGMLAFSGKPVPLQRQARISINIPGVSVPLIGFADWVWGTHGSDLKTTWRIPSEPNPSHVQQMAAYSRYFECPFELVYVSPKRWVRYEIPKQTTDEAWQTVVDSAQSLQSFLIHA